MLESYKQRRWKERKYFQNRIKPRYRVIFTSSQYREFKYPLSSTRLLWYLNKPVQRESSRFWYQHSTITSRYRYLFSTCTDGASTTLVLVLLLCSSTCYSVQFANTHFYLFKFFSIFIHVKIIFNKFEPRFLKNYSSTNKINILTRYTALRYIKICPIRIQLFLRNCLCTIPYCSLIKLWSTISQKLLNRN